MSADFWMGVWTAAICYWIGRWPVWSKLWKRLNNKLDEWANIE
jgi:hypothetical protein